MDDARFDGAGRLRRAWFRQSEGRPRMSRRAVIGGVGGLALMQAFAPSPVRAAVLAFDGEWEALTFRRIPATTYELAGQVLRVRAEASSSVIYRAVPEALRGVGRASWRWSVTRSVPATDLGRKGGDDRNLSLYFVFMDAAAAARVRPGTALTRLMSNRSARSLLYVWGGGHAQGAAIPSPYFRGRGTSIVLRPAGTGAHRETVDLRADHARLFGAVPEVLVGIAVSSDSDDTSSVVEAEISDLDLS